MINFFRHLFFGKRIRVTSEDILEGERNGKKNPVCMAISREIQKKYPGQYPECQVIARDNETLIRIFYGWKRKGSRILINGQTLHKLKDKIGSNQIWKEYSFIPGGRKIRKFLQDFRGRKIVKPFSFKLLI